MGTKYWNGVSTYHDYKTTSGTKRYNLTWDSNNGMMIVNCKQLGGSPVRFSVIVGDEVENIYTYGSVGIISSSYIEIDLQNVALDIICTVPLTVS